MNKMDVRRRQADLFSAALAILILWIFGKRVGEYGIAYLCGAVLCLGTLWAVIGSHLSEAMGKMLRIRYARGQYRNAAGSRRNIMVFQGTFGLLGSALLLVFAKPVAEIVIGIPECTLVIMMLSPFLFLHTIAAMLKGYLQGAKAEPANIAGGLLRQAFILGFGLLWEGKFHAYGDKVSALLGQEKFAYMYGAIGIAFGIVMAELLVVFFLFFMNQSMGKKFRKQENEGKKTVERFGTHLRVSYSYRGSMILTGLLGVLPFFFGIYLFLKEQEDYNKAVTELGSFAGGYLCLCLFLIFLIAISVVSVPNRVISLIRREEQRNARRYFLGGLHIGIVHAVFWSVILTVLSEPAGELLGIGGEMTGQLLAKGSALILVGVLGYYFLKVLTGLGGQYFAVGIQGLGDIVFAAVYLLAAGKGQGIQAFMPALVAALAVECLLFGFLVFKRLHAGWDALAFAILPAGLGCVAGLIAMFLKNILLPHLGAASAMIVCVVCSGGIYWAALLLSRNFKEEELEYLPGGKYIKSMGEMFRVYRGRR